MKVLSALAMILASSISHLVASEASTVGDKWRVAYFGDNQSIRSHLVSWQPKSVEDGIMRQFYIAYVDYKFGYTESPEKIFEIVDELIRENIFIPSSKE